MKELSTAQLDRWCKTATEQIRFGPDRRRVAEELRNHLEDHRMSLIEQGMNQQEANLQALEAMGSAEELAPQLAAIHKPFWGRVIRTCRLLLVLLLLCGALPVFNYYHALCYDAPDMEDICYDFSYSEARGYTIQHFSPAKVSFSSDGSTFTVTDAMIMSNKFGYCELQILVEQRSLLPWTQHSKYLTRTYELIYSPSSYYTEVYNNLDSRARAVAMFTKPVTNRFYAIDSTGQRYDNIFEQNQDTEHFISGYVRGGLFSCTILLGLPNFEPEGVEWVDLCYDRDGRSFTLRVDLTGGATE